MTIESELNFAESINDLNKSLNFSLLKRKYDEYINLNLNYKEAFDLALQNSTRGSSGGND